MIYQREFKAAKNALANISGGPGLWMHIYGEPGNGNEAFLEALKKRLLKDYRLPVEHHFGMFPVLSPIQEKQFYRQAFQRYPEEFEKFRRQYSGKLQRLISDFLQDDGSAGELMWNADPWEHTLFREFLNFLSGRGPTAVILESIFDEVSKPATALIDLLRGGGNTPMVIVTTGREALLETRTTLEVLQINIRRLSVQQTEKLIAAQTGLRQINARLISNHLYIKSGGNQRKIRMMLPAFYEPLILPGKDYLIDHARLSQVRVSGASEQIFSELLKQLSEPMLNVFAFLCRLNDPFPQDLLLLILTRLAMSRDDYKDCLRHGFLDEREFFGQPHVAILWPKWKAFLRQHTSIERVPAILEIIRGKLKRRQWTVPLELSGLFYDAGDAETALTLAFREARLLAAQGHLKRALERYGFVKRNHQRHPQAKLNLETVLADMSEVQQSLGLYENAFEALREQRERLSRSQRQQWMTTSLKMADFLYQMDALSEARYLIKELQIKNRRSPATRVYANLLLGELEQDSGHAAYALRHYEAALADLPAAADEDLALRLYGILKKHYEAGEDDGRHLLLIEEMLVSLPENSAFRPFFLMEKIRYYFGRNELSAALETALQLQRSRGGLVSPGILVRLWLYLAEIYGYAGKWHLSRSYLNRLLNATLLTAQARSRIGILVNAGVVEKELGHFGRALDLLESAEKEAREARLPREQYQATAHLGHIYLLVHSPLRARERLTAVLKWAEESQDQDMIVLAALFLSSYELQQQRTEPAIQFLSKAREIIELTQNPLDRLNFNYYQLQYDIQTGNLTGAAAGVSRWRSEIEGVVKFENLACWLSGKVAMESGDVEAAIQELQAALARARRYRLPHLAFLVLRDLAVLAKRSGDDRLAAYPDQAHNAFQELLNAVGDEILQRQIEESRTFDALANL